MVGGAAPATHRVTPAVHRVVPATFGSAPPAAALRSGRGWGVVGGWEVGEVNSENASNDIDLIFDESGLPLFGPDQWQPHPWAVDSPEPVQKVLRRHRSGHMG